MKKGFAHKGHSVMKVNPRWYYNWGMYKTPGVDCEFIPMVWGSTYRKPNQKNPRFILGFNEPDLHSQANMSPDKALDLWHRVKGILIGSPATAENPVTGTWLKEFKGRYDFICIHWYGHCVPYSFLRYVDSVWEWGHKPIWITEFAVVDKEACSSDVVNFMKLVLPELEKRPWVQRYAWKHIDGCSSIFARDGKTLTDVGRFYSIFGCTKTKCNTTS